MLTDAVLVDRVIAGFDGAFDELYRRHVDAAWRLGQSVTGNSHDASDAVSEAFARVLQAVRDGRLQDGDAFRSYLLTATRNAALDNLRRTGKARPTDDEHLDAVDLRTPAENLTGSEDADMVAEAFRNLPERWRSVLWLTEVEGVATKDAATVLGMSPNGTAQLAVRARAGLRERFLQAHLRREAAPGCRFTVDRLGAYVGGALSPRDLAKVDQHLAGCEPCRLRKEELEDVGSSLRRIVLPIPLALAALSFGKVRAVLASTSSAAPGLAGRALHLAKNPTPAVRRFVASSAAGVLGLGMLSLGFVGDTPSTASLAAPGGGGTGAAASVDLPDATLSTRWADFAPPASSGQPASSERPIELPRSAPDFAPAPAPPATPAPSDTPPAAAPPAGDDTPSPPPGDDTATDPAPATPPAEDEGGGVVEVTAGANLSVTSGGVSVTVGPEPAAAVTVADQPVVGAEPVDTPAEPGIEVEVGGDALPEPVVLP